MAALHLNGELPQLHCNKPDVGKAIQRLQLMLLLHYPRMGILFDQVEEKYRDFFAEELPDAVCPTKTNKSTILATISHYVAIFTFEGEEYIRGKPFSKEDALNIIVRELMSIEDILEDMSEIITEDATSAGIRQTMMSGARLQEIPPLGIITPAQSIRSASNICMPNSVDLLPPTSEDLEQRLPNEARFEFQNDNPDKIEQIAKSGPVSLPAKRKIRDNSCYSILNSETCSGETATKQLYQDAAKRARGEANELNNEAVKVSNVYNRARNSNSIVGQPLVVTIDDENSNLIASKYVSNEISLLSVSSAINETKYWMKPARDVSEDIHVQFSALPENIQKFIGFGRPSIFREDFPKNFGKIYRRGPMKNYTCIVSCGKPRLFLSFDGCVYEGNPPKQLIASSTQTTFKKVKRVSLPDNTLIYGEVFKCIGTQNTRKVLCVFDCGFLQSKDISELFHENRMARFMAAIRENKPSPKQIPVLQGRLIEIQYMFDYLKTGKWDKVPLEKSMHPEQPEYKLKHPVSHISFYHEDRAFKSAMKTLWSWRYQKDSIKWIASRVSEMLKTKNRDADIYRFLLKHT